MRKKRHLRIDSKNKAYDRFYMVNYLEMGRGWQDIQKEDDVKDDVKSDSEEEYVIIISIMLMNTGLRIQGSMGGLD